MDKLMNCGQCGLEPVAMRPVPLCDFHGAVCGSVETYGCPVHDVNEESGASKGQWNAAQFAARTERINAAALATLQGLSANPAMEELNFSHMVEAATIFIDAQDAATRARWAELNGEAQ